MHSSSAMQASRKLDRASFVFLIVNLLPHSTTSSKCSFIRFSWQRSLGQILIQCQKSHRGLLWKAIRWILHHAISCQRSGMFALAISIADACNFYCQWPTTTREDPVENMTPDIVQQGFQIRWKLLCVYLVPTFFGQPGLPTGQTKLACLLKTDFCLFLQHSAFPPLDVHCILWCFLKHRVLQRS